MADRPPGPDTGVRPSRSMQSATRSSNQQVGGSSGDWRHRLLRFHVPLVLASALVLVLFFTLPRFDASAYPALDMHSSAPLPQGRETMDMQDMDLDRSGDHDGPMGEGADQSNHGGGQTGPMREGADQPAGDHGGNEAERMGGDS